MKTRPRSRRHILLGQIHQAKSALGMPDDDYRLMLNTYFGVHSAADLDQAGLLALIQRFRDLGWQRGSTVSALKPPRQDGAAITAQANKIRALWLTLGAAGVVKSIKDSSLNKYVKRMTGIDQVDWLPAKKAIIVIEALKKWAARTGVKI